jgi:hypothetical protein
METTAITTPVSTNFNTLQSRILSCVSSACDVRISDIMSSTKRREAAIAKSIFCVMMVDNGFSKSETARCINADNKSVHYYLDSHSEKMSDNSYKSMYDKSLVLFENYAKDIIDYDHAINDLRKMVMDLQSKYEHIKELLIN